MPSNKLVPVAKERDRVTVTLSPQMRDRVNKVAAMMGFGTSEAVRYLMARGLEGVTAVTATSESANALKSMMELFEASEQRERDQLKGRKSGSGPSNTRTTAEKSTGASLFDVPSRDEKKRRK